MKSETNSFEELDANSVTTGIGRKASDKELNEYLSKDIDAEPINLNKAFSQYSIKLTKIDKSL